MLRRQNKVGAILLVAALALTMLPPVAFAEDIPQDVAPLEADAAQGGSVPEQAETPDEAAPDEAGDATAETAEDTAAVPDETAKQPDGEAASGAKDGGAEATPPDDDATEDTEGMAFLPLLEDTPEPAAEDKPLALLASGIPIDATTFPDNTFRAYVEDAIDTDKDKTLSDAEANAVEDIYVNGGYQGTQIGSLTGIEYFPNLLNLGCNSNQLTSLDVSSNTALVDLVCSNNQLAALDVGSNTALEYLDCQGNHLASLDVGANTALKHLNCGANWLASLDVGANTALVFLDCSYNGLASLDVGANTALERLDCSSNQLASLDVSANTALRELLCFGNPLASLDVGANAALVFLDCSYNHLLDIMGLPAGLPNFNGSGQKVTVLVHADPSAPGSYVSDSAYDFGTHSIALDSTAASFDVASGRFAATSLDAPIGFTTDDGTGQTITGTVTFKELLGIPIDTTTFPDNTFRAYVEDVIDTNGDKALSDAEADAVEDIDVRGYQGAPISSLAGIEYFPNLLTLWCGGNQLASLDVGGNTALRELYCNDNQLTSLDVGGNTALWRLNCSNNQLASLDVSRNTALEIFHCNGNQLASLDVSRNTALGVLSCYNNQLASLDVGGNTALEVLDCSYNQLASLDVSRNTALVNLGCSDNHLLDIIGLRTGLFGFNGSGQTVTVPVHADPSTPGSYISDSTYNFDTHSIALDSTAASFDAASGRFAATSLDAPIGFTTDDGTGQAITGTVTFKEQGPPPSDAKDITSFVLEGVSGTISGTAISVTLPYGTDVTALTPVVVYTGVSIAPTGAQNFSTPVVYTVKAEDNSTKDYTVIVNVALAPPPPPPPSSDKDISSFVLEGVSGTISGTAISVTLPYGTNLTALTPVVTHTGVSYTPTGAQNFSTPVVYTVKAADNSTKDYTVTVTLASPPPAGAPLVTTPGRDKPEYVIGAKDDYVIRIDKDFALYDSATGITVDGQNIPSEYYTVASGSTIVTIKAAYLDSLGKGTHAFVIPFVDGTVVTHGVSVKSGAEDKENTAAGDTSLPRTGDMGGLALMLIAALSTTTGALILSKGRRRQRA